MSDTSTKEDLGGARGDDSCEGGIERTVVAKTAIDYVLEGARAAVGPIPIVGPLLSELVGHVVPNQRIDRIAKFAAELEHRLSRLETRDRAMEWPRDEAFTELLEEAMRQAARSLSDERRRHLADLIANSVSSKEITAVESRHLLQILGEINDLEVLWLRFHQVPTLGGDENFRETHREALAPAVATFGSSQTELDKATLQDSYREHLYRLGLLKRRYKREFGERTPVFDSFTGQQEWSGYEITPLGRLLLRRIGLASR